MLDAEERVEDSGSEKTFNAVDIEREEHAIHMQIIARHRFLAAMRLKILAAIKAKDAEAFAKLTKDDELRAFAARELFSSPGRRKNQPKRGQRFVTEFERELLLHMVDIRDRVTALWKAHGVRGPAKLGLTPTDLAVERVMGPEALWEPIPPALWPLDPKSRPRSWRQRRDEIERLLTNFLKNRRKKPPRRNKPTR